MSYTEIDQPKKRALYKIRQEPNKYGLVDTSLFRVHDETI